MGRNSELALHTMQGENLVEARLCMATQALSGTADILKDFPGVGTIFITKPVVWPAIVSWPVKCCPLMGSTSVMSLQELLRSTSGIMDTEKECSESRLEPQIRQESQGRRVEHLYNGKDKLWLEHSRSMGNYKRSNLYDSGIERISC